MRTSNSEERHIICVVRGKTPNREKVKELLLELVGPARLAAPSLWSRPSANDPSRKTAPPP
jgi:hypothetical protein